MPWNRHEVHGAALISTISRAEAEASLGPRVALVAEDEWMILLQMGEALQLGGWTVHEADRPESALAILRAQPEIALLVTDIRFGTAMDGWQLASEARRINPDIAVIYASANERRADEMVPGGVFLGKPCVMSDILETAEALLGRG